MRSCLAPTAGALNIDALHCRLMTIVLQPDGSAPVSRVAFRATLVRWHAARWRARSVIYLHFDRRGTPDEGTRRPAACHRPALLQRAGVVPPGPHGERRHRLSGTQWQR